jgi:hypothetical protein
VGNIQKKWSGFVQETFTDAENFGVEFDPGLSDAAKALIFGAVFLIDFMYHAFLCYATLPQCLHTTHMPPFFTSSYQFLTGCRLQVFRGQ